MIFRTISRFCTNQFGIPLKFLDAMNFDIPKSAEERYMHLRTLTNRIQDRLMEDQLKDFIKDFQYLRDRNLTCQNTLKSHIFKLFNEYKILDLVPLCMKIDFKEVQQELFEDEFQRIGQDYQSDYHYFITHKSAIFKPHNKTLTEHIQYKRKHILSLTKKRNDFRLTQYEEQIDNQLIKIIKEYNNQIPQEHEEISIDDKIQICKQHRIIKTKILKTTPTQPNYSKTSLILKQIADQAFTKSNKVGCYGLPYIIDEQFKSDFQAFIETQIGKIHLIRYHEYSNYRQVRMGKGQENDAGSQSDNENQRLTRKMLDRIRYNKNRKLQKSYAVIEFEGEEEKKRALLNDLRIFGMKFKDQILKFDDVDHKNILYINNVNKHRPVREFVDFLEVRLGCKFETEDERSFLMNGTVSLICKDFQETLRIHRILEKQQFSKFQLSLFHYPEGLRYIGAEISEQLNINNILYKLYEQQMDIRFQWNEQEEENNEYNFIVHPQSIVEYDTKDDDEEDYQLSIDDLQWDEAYY